MHDNHCTSADGHDSFIELCNFCCMRETPEYSIYLSGGIKSERGWRSWRVAIKALVTGMIDSEMIGSMDFHSEGCRESRRCSRDTYPESYINKYTSIRRLFGNWAHGILIVCRPRDQVPQRESCLLTTCWSESTSSTRRLCGPASRHGSLNFLFQIALHQPS
jgi:hypothetical protein